MVFSSLLFISVFLPLVFILHCILPSIRLKNGMLLVAGLIFYAYGEPVYVFLLVGTSFANYLFALWIDGRREQKKTKMILFLAIAVDLFVLVIFKYTGFLVQSVNDLCSISLPVPDIRLPVGISFFTFQAMSYVIDVYRGTNRASKNFGTVLLYISFFPQLIAGPIVKYHDIEKELSDRKPVPEGIHAGIRRFILGLSKKVLIANTMAVVTTTFLPDTEYLLSAE